MSGIQSLSVAQNSYHLLSSLKTGELMNEIDQIIHLLTLDNLDEKQQQALDNLFSHDWTSALVNHLKGEESASLNTSTLRAGPQGIPNCYFQAISMIANMPEIKANLASYVRNETYGQHAEAGRELSSQLELLQKRFAPKLAKIKQAHEVIVAKQQGKESAAQLASAYCEDHHVWYVQPKQGRLTRRYHHLIVKTNELAQQEMRRLMIEGKKALSRIEKLRLGDDRVAELEQKATAAEQDAVTLDLNDAKAQRQFAKTHREVMHVQHKLTKSTEDLELVNSRWVEASTTSLRTMFLMRPRAVVAARETHVAASEVRENKQAFNESSAYTPYMVHRGKVPGVNRLVSMFKRWRYGGKVQVIGNVNKKREELLGSAVHPTADRKIYDRMQAMANTISGKVDLRSNEGLKFSGQVMHLAEALANNKYRFSLLYKKVLMLKQVDRSSIDAAAHRAWINVGTEYTQLAAELARLQQQIDALPKMSDLAGGKDSFQQDLEQRRQALVNAKNNFDPLAGEIIGEETKALVDNLQRLVTLKSPSKQDLVDAMVCISGLSNTMVGVGCLSAIVDEAGFTNLMQNLQSNRLPVAKALAEDLNNMSKHAFAACFADTQQIDKDSVYHLQRHWDHLIVYVQSSLLGHGEVGTMKQAIQIWMQVANELLERRDYASFDAVLRGLDVVKGQLTEEVLDDARLMEQYNALVRTDKKQYLPTTAKSGEDTAYVVPVDLSEGEVVIPSIQTVRAALERGTKQIGQQYTEQVLAMHKFCVAEDNSASNDSALQTSLQNFYYSNSFINQIGKQRAGDVAENQLLDQLIDGDEFDVAHYENLVAKMQQVQNPALLECIYKYAKPIVDAGSNLMLAQIIELDAEVAAMEFVSKEEANAFSQRAKELLADYAVPSYFISNVAKAYVREKPALEEKVSEEAVTDPMSDEIEAAVAILSESLTVAQPAAEQQLPFYRHLPTAAKAGLYGSVGILGGIAAMHGLGMIPILHSAFASSPLLSALSHLGVRAAVSASVVGGAVSTVASQFGLFGNRAVADEVEEPSSSETLGL